MSILVAGTVCLLGRLSEGNRSRRDTLSPKTYMKLNPKRQDLETRPSVVKPIVMRPGLYKV